MARKIAVGLGLVHVELDALYHGPDWTPAEPDAFRAAVMQVVEGAGWVVDGNYRTALGGVVADRADLMLAIDLRVPVTMSRIILGEPSPVPPVGTGGRESRTGGWHAVHQADLRRPGPAVRHLPHGRLTALARQAATGLLRTIRISRIPSESVRSAPSGMNPWCT